MSPFSERAHAVGSAPAAGKGLGKKGLHLGILDPQGRELRGDVRETVEGRPERADPGGSVADLTGAGNPRNDGARAMVGDKGHGPNRSHPGLGPAKGRAAGGPGKLPPPENRGLGLDIPAAMRKARPSHPAPVSGAACRPGFSAVPRPPKASFRMKRRAWVATWARRTSA